MASVGTKSQLRLIIEPLALNRNRRLLTKAYLRYCTGYMQCLDGWDKPMLQFTLMGWEVTEL
jgi:hypothetical protein